VSLFNSDVSTDWPIIQKKKGGREINPSAVLTAWRSHGSASFNGLPVPKTY
jgi:hypothetical protein